MFLCLSLTRSTLTGDISLAYRCRIPGDVIQTRTLTSLLPPTVGVQRHALDEVDPRRIFVQDCRRADTGFSSGLHVALKCLAFGTPRMLHKATKILKFGRVSDIPTAGPHLAPAASLPKLA